jgi:glutamine synthetase
MPKYVYIWTDAAGQFRSKVRWMEGEPTDWSYDGSSTGQATMESSEVVLKPVMVYMPKAGSDLYNYVLCALRSHAGGTVVGDVFEPLSAEKRAVLKDVRVAFEQEFFVFDGVQPYKMGDWTHVEQGPFYCSVGVAGNGFIEPLVREVFERAVTIGIGATGYNLEVAPAQGEIQVDGPAFKAACDLVMLRYLLWDTLGRHGLQPNFEPKPLGPHRNGSGLHTNISTDKTMSSGGFDIVKRLMSDLSDAHVAWMPLLGEGNAARLTGLHETSTMDSFSWAVGSRGSSVRIPYSTARDGFGYFEDRRPAANANPFQILALYADILAAA